MSSVSSTSSSTSYNRMTGLATGVDTDKYVEQMMSGDQTKLDKANQNEQYTEWQQEAYVDIITKLKDFYKKYLDTATATSDTSMLNANNFNGVAASVSDDDSKYISASTLPGAAKGIYSIAIEKLASGAKVENTSGTLTAGDLSIKIGDKTFNVNVTSTMTMDDFINSLKNTYSGDDALTNHVNINYSQLTGKLSLETKDTGFTAEMQISGTAAGIFGGAATSNGNDAVVYITEPGMANPVKKTESSNKFTIDGVTYNLQSPSPTDSASSSTLVPPITEEGITEKGGVVYNTTRASDGTLTTTMYGQSNISVKANADDSYKKIKAFFDDYNTLIGDINTKLTEKKDSDYQPLTDAQKKDMTEDQITKWETKAKKGILRNDTVLSGMLTSLREAVYGTVKGAGLTNTQIGITTTSDYKNGGKIQIDESKLKDALENRADQVFDLFSQYSFNGSSSDDTKGIIRKFGKIVDGVVGFDGTLIQKAGYTDTRWEVTNDLSKSITEQKKKITLMKENFAEKQQRYYNMFATLEANMNKLNSQSSWLSSALS
ncbi:flagellar filament capping protein FliD [Clostridium oryzae]|uniref:Flagellar hook-associated protein 2 n=1 Tax=Clostridium oryzae TaxID=1450648 RepID=A0A1V4ILG3_9CLOT|nr:flagellar filament capping protein FliD [Clostridium oryzae]OPJ60881.1 flagellar capping protein [Clostridium oryzae]